MKRTYPRHIAAIIDEAMDRAGLTDSLIEAINKRVGSPTVTEIVFH